MPHTASRMNPIDALAQAGRESRHAYERELRLPSEEAICKLAASLGGDRGPAVLALTAKMAHDAGTFDDEEAANLARKIKLYGDERAESAIERYQEWGE